MCCWPLLPHLLILAAFNRAYRAYRPYLQANNVGKQPTNLAWILEIMYTSKVLTPCGLSAGYQRLDYAVGAVLKDMGNTLTVAYAHNVDASLSAGAEISKRLNEKEGTSFTLGCASDPLSSLSARHSCNKPCAPVLP